MADAKQKNISISDEAKDLLEQLCKLHVRKPGQMVEYLILKQAKEDKLTPTKPSTKTKG